MSGAGLRGAYAALSYCWGGNSTLTTTTKTLKEHEAGLDLLGLHRVFQDAISVASSLGLAYIWIDALCIVQDDLSEWAHEAAQMANVFSNTFPEAEILLAPLNTRAW